MELKNRVAVVTGASSGMGRAIVAAFVKEGADVVAVARRGGLLEELAKELSDLPGRAAVYPGDVSDRAVNEDMINFAVRTFGTLDILVNNAGVMDSMAGVGEMTDERFEQVMRVNVYGPVYGTRKAVRYFLSEGKSGNIISVSSLSAWHTTGGAAYSASKAAVIAMTKNTAYHYGSNGIRCNAIAPGSITTKITSSMGKPDLSGMMRSMKVMKGRPKKSGTADDIAQLVLFLAGDASSHVNGAVIPIDGGWDTM